LSAPVPLVVMYWSSCSGLTRPLRSISWVVMIWSGNALSFGSRRMREPVTVIDWTASVLSWVVEVTSRLRPG
jgi:hypothetical protein